MVGVYLGRPLTLTLSPAAGARGPESRIATKMWK